jgi:hypothetical protein
LRSRRAGCGPSRGGFRGPGRVRPGWVPRWLVLLTRPCLPSWSISSPTSSTRIPSACAPPMPVPRQSRSYQSPARRLKPCCVSTSSAPGGRAVRARAGSDMRLSRCAWASSTWSDRQRWPNACRRASSEPSSPSSSTPPQTRSPRNGDVFGPVVNLAARAVKVAAAGEVVAPVALASAAGIEAEPLGSHQLRGFDDDVELCRLRTARAEWVPGSAHAGCVSVAPRASRSK